MSDSSGKAAERAIAMGAQAQLALPIALRAIAHETRGKTARDLNQLATHLDSGMTIEAATEELDKVRSTPLAALIRAGTRAGTLGGVLAEVSQLAETRRTLRSEWMLALAYPAIMLLATLLLASFAFNTLVPAMKFELGDQITIPGLKVVFAVGGAFVRMIWILVLWIVVGFALARLVLGKVRFGWLITTVPLIGPLFFWTSTWEWLVLVRQLVTRDVPLPESLRLVAESVSAAHLAAASRKLADRIEAGESLEHVLHHTAALPTSIAPLLGWGAARQSLAESLQLAADAMAERVRLRVAWLSLVVPPVLFLLIAALVGCVVTSCLYPMVVLIQNLS